MSLLLVVRHTRAEEEAGRTELVGAAVRRPVRRAGRRFLVAVRREPRRSRLLAPPGSLAAGLPRGRLGRAGPGDGPAPGSCSRPWRAVTAQVASVARAASGPAGRLLGLAVPAAGDRRRRAGALAVLAVADRLGAAGAGVRRRALVGPRCCRWRSSPGCSAPPRRCCRGGTPAPGCAPQRPGPAGADARGWPARSALAWRLQRGTLLGWTAGYVLVGAAARRGRQRRRRPARQRPAGHAT